MRATSRGRAKRDAKEEEEEVEAHESTEKKAA